LSFRAEGEILMIIVWFLLDSCLRGNDRNVEHWIVTSTRGRNLTAI